MLSKAEIQNSIAALVKDIKDICQKENLLIYVLSKDMEPLLTAIDMAIPFEVKFTNSPKLADVGIAYFDAKKYQPVYVAGAENIIESYDMPVAYFNVSSITELPWTSKHHHLTLLAEATGNLLQHLDPNPERGGLAETPMRMAKAWAKWTEGYSMDAAEILKVFEDGAEKCDEMVIVKDIPIYSKCEHHLADIFGTATIAYIPDGKIVGLSKLSRLADMFSRRLQVQERLTNDIADAIEEHLQPLGVAVVIRARHMCMESRGICQQGHHTITSALRGKLKTDAAARQEFMQLANNNIKV